MKKAILILLFITVFFSGNHLLAQEAFKFGKVTLADFDVKSPLINSNTNAIIIADIGNSEFESLPNNGSFAVSFKHQKRIKLINKNGFDLANVEIPLWVYDNGKIQLMEDFKAATYNVENGKVIETKLEKNAIYTENNNKHWAVKKFTFPAIKEGSIIEFSYTIRSESFFHLHDWVFQGKYPCLWSEYNVAVPEYFKYIFVPQGASNFAVHTSESKPVEYTFRHLVMSEAVVGEHISREYFNIKSTVNLNRWVMTNVPAWKEEPYITTLKNHIPKIEFQLSQVHFPHQIIQNVANNWGKVNKELVESNYFGVPISKSNSWLDYEIPSILGTNSSMSKTEVVKKIFVFIRDSFAVKSHGYELGTNSLKDIFKQRSGSVAELNLLLIAMLKHEKISADPVILSTRENGIVNPIYPLLDRFNYLICKVFIEGYYYYLDASVPHLGFGRLPLHCYNGYARLISEFPDAVYLNPDSLCETKSVAVFAANGKDGIEATYSSDLGYYESLSFRTLHSLTHQEDYFNRLAKEYPTEVKIENPEIDSLKNYDEPVTVKYDLKLNLGDDDIIYFNPILNEGIKTNPFKSATRLYPVEMPYKTNQLYSLDMDVPKGYKVDELPKSVRVKLNETDGMFEYLISQDDNNIKLQCRLVLYKTKFPVEDYQNLRDFYTYVIKKQSEQIVFKKIK